MEKLKQKGLNSFQLKLTGLILMVFDHIYEFFSFTGDIPIVFTWFGRIVAPIFMFLTVEGYMHTRSKRKYMLRLYIGSLIMYFGNYIIPKLLPRADAFMINNNIFSTLLMMVIYMLILDYLTIALKEKDVVKITLSALFIIIPFVLGSSMISIANVTNLDFLKYILPNIYLVEGGPVLVLLGIIFYITRNDLYKLIESYLIFSLVLLLGSTIESKFSIKDLFLENFQWMMVFSILFFKAYNGEKGRGLKYLFYIFYPTHIYLLYILSVFVMN